MEVLVPGLRDLRGEAVDTSGRTYDGWPSGLQVEYGLET